MISIDNGYNTNEEKLAQNVIIIDIEWDPNSAVECPSLLQLAAVKIKNNQISDSFFSFIKPNEMLDIEKILNFMPITQENLLSGRELSSVMSEFSHWCGTEYSFIIWGSYNFMIFKKTTEGYLQIDQSNTQDLQQVYMIISETNATNLEKASIDSGVRIFYPLHHALNDSYTLAELYSSLKEKYDFDALMKQFMLHKEQKRKGKRKAKRKRQVFRRAMAASSTYQFFVDKDSGMVHNKDCPCLKDTVSQLKGFDTMKGALRDSIILCAECFKGAVNLDKDLTVSEMIQIIELHNLCFNYKLRSKNQGRMFFITTHAGKWFFELGTKNPTLRHQNNIYASKHQKGLNQYHKQPVNFTSEQEVILYISKHDSQVLSGNYKTKTVKK